MASNPAATAALQVLPSPSTGPTGPRTAAGKARVAQNALKHGLNSRAAVIPGEDRDAFLAYRGRLFAEWLPKGADEEDLVEKMAAANWRTQRLWEFEAAVYRGERQHTGSARPRPLDCFARDGEDTATTLARIDHKESTLDRRYDRHLRRLLLLQAHRRKGLRPAVAYLAKRMAEAAAGSAETGATASGEPAGNANPAAGDSGGAASGGADRDPPPRGAPGRTDFPLNGVRAAIRTDAPIPSPDLPSTDAVTPAIVGAHRDAPKPTEPSPAPAAIATPTAYSDGISRESAKQTPRAATALRAARAGGLPEAPVTPCDAPHSIARRARVADPMAYLRGIPAHRRHTHGSALDSP